MTRYLDTAVLEVLAGGPDAQIGVQLGNDGDSYAVMSCVGMNYDPQRGDIVRIDMDSIHGQPFVFRCLTPGRTFVPPSAGLTVSTSPPSDSDYGATSAVYAKNGAIWAVRSFAPPPGTGGKLVVAPVDSGTWDASNGWRSGLLRQGVFPGSGAAACTGLWLYPAGAFSSLAGHTITGISVQIGRASGVGTPYAPKPIRLVEHAYTAAPAAAPVTANPTHTDIELGATNVVKAFTVETSYAADLASGAATGLGIASSSPDDYLACLGGSGSGTLTITWSS